MWGRILKLNLCTVYPKIMVGFREPIFKKIRNTFKKLKYNLKIPQIVLNIISMFQHVHHLWTWLCPINIPFLATHTVAHLLLPAEWLFLFLSSYDSDLKFCPHKSNSLHSPKRRNQVVSNQGYQVATELNHPCQSIFQEMLL